MIHYGLIPIDRLPDLIQTYENKSTTFKKESDTGILDSIGNSIYVKSQWIILKDSNWNQNRTDEVLSFEGQVFTDTIQLKNWLNVIS